MKPISRAAGEGGHLELGMFGPNGTGHSMSKAPERWYPTWENNRDLALAAEAAGMEFHIPFARWKGHGGESNPQGAMLDPVVWAAGVLAITKRIKVFTTVHTPFVHPIVMAKHLATMDHIGPGRVGLNIVSGWDREEFEMFGIPLREHDERYEYTKDWLDVMRTLWTADEPGHHRGRFFDLPGLIGEPKPRGKITLMNAGTSSAGRAFAIEHCDLLFNILVSPEACREEVAKVKEAARRVGRSIDVYTTACIVCRPTRKEAEDYHDYYSREMADWPATDHLMQLLGMDCQSFSPEFYAMFRHRFAAAHGHYSIVGDPGHVADEIRRIRDTGVRGLTLGFMDFASEFSSFKDEVMPRLVDLGVRRPPG